LVETLGDINLAGFNARPGYRGNFLKFLSGCRNQVAQIDIQPRDKARDQAPFLLQQGKQKMFAIDLDMPEMHGKTLGRLQRLLGFLRHPIDIHDYPLLSFFKILPVSWLFSRPLGEKKGRDQTGLLFPE
jgi:hypothetical protein